MLNNILYVDDERGGTTARIIDSLKDKYDCNVDWKKDPREILDDEKLDSKFYDIAILAVHVESEEEFTMRDLNQLLEGHGSFSTMICISSGPGKKPLDHANKYIRLSDYFKTSVYSPKEKELKRLIEDIGSFLQ